ncbi:5-formyltetrahydrofolate cyclo-ligase [Chromatiaceae bacterium AAb-1]|nr:5-formyltetrahydrofolate cyclo-ligase [Chromatiaceae bacterium AAb-1]
MSDRNTLRQHIRKLRRALSPEQQQQASRLLVQQFFSVPLFARQQHIAVYLSNDGEADTTPLINALWQAGKQLYLPVLHPFSTGSLLFIEYTPSTPLYPNRFGIPEPQLQCHKICPLPELDLILTPLVAFDQQGNRLGMGGGFYDRTLATSSLQRKPYLAGIAHQCQQVAQLPSASWDVPLPVIITPEKIWQFQPLPESF